MELPPSKINSAFHQEVDLHRGDTGGWPGALAIAVLDRTRLLMLCADDATQRQLEQAGQHVLGPVSDRLDFMPPLDELVVKVVEPDTMILWETVLRLEALVTDRG